MTSALMMDTQPIPVDDLTEAARAQLREILKILNEIRDENRRLATPKRQKQDPWAVLDHGRTYRVIMLDGPRGTGKTSLLLTLIDQWTRRRDPRRWQSEKPQRELLRPDDVGIRPLTPLDFDPHPEHLHPYVWLVLAFQPIVEWLTYTDGRRARDEPGERPLDEIWQELYTQALIGWDADVQRKQMAADIDGFVATSLESHRGWHHLRESWQRFVDRTLAGLEQNREMESDDLLVLPIDDLDLHRSMAGNLLRALRLMRHRRLVFLLTGDSDHLRQVLTRELLPTHALEDAQEARREVKFQYYRKLASDIVDKAIPTKGRFPVPLLTLAQALSFVVYRRDIERSMQYEEHVERLLDENVPDRALLARWIAMTDEPNYRYRDVVKIAHETTNDDLEALCLLTTHRDGSLVFQRESNPSHPGFVRNEPCALRVIASYGGPRDRPDRDEENRVLIATALNPRINATADIAAQGATYILEYLNPMLVRGAEFVSSNWSEMQVTDWSTNDPLLPLRVLWPLVEPSRTLRDLERRRASLLHLREVFETRLLAGSRSFESAREFRSNARTVASFMAWVWTNIEYDVNEYPEAGLSELWTILNRRPFEWRRQRADFFFTVQDWCEYRLPILAAPEYGLPPSVAEQMIHWLREWPGRSHTLDAAYLKRLEEVRHAGLRESFSREQQTHADPASRADDALRWIAVRFDDHPWYKFVSSLTAPPDSLDTVSSESAIEPHKRRPHKKS